MHFAKIGGDNAQELLFKAVKGAEGLFSHHVAGLAGVALMATGDKKYAGYFLDKKIKTGFTTHYDSRESKPNPTHPNFLQECFGDYAEYIYHAAHNFFGILSGSR